jgi:hypothetical protein
MRIHLLTLKRCKQIEKQGYAWLTKYNRTELKQLLSSRGRLPEEDIYTETELKRLLWDCISERVAEDKVEVFDLCHMTPEEIHQFAKSIGYDLPVSKTVVMKNRLMKTREWKIHTGEIVLPKITEPTKPIRHKIMTSVERSRERLKRMHASH